MWIFWNFRVTNFVKRYESFISFVRFLILSEFVIQTTGRCSTDEPISCQCCILIPPGNVIKHGLVMFSGDYKTGSLAWNELKANFAIKVIGIWETTSQLTFPFLKLIKNTRKMCERCSKLTIKTPERCNCRRPGVFIVNPGHISHPFLRCL